MTIAEKQNTPMRVRVPAGKEAPSYFNYAIVLSNDEEVVLSFVYGEDQSAGADNTLVHKLACTPATLDRLIEELTKVRDAIRADRLRRARS